MKLIINKSQLLNLKQNISEGLSHSNLVKRIKTELDMNYQPINKFIRKGGEYFDQLMIMVKADEETIKPKDLFEYLKSKYKVGDTFIKQVITDWINGEISDDYTLTKNVTLD